MMVAPPATRKVPMDCFGAGIRLDAAKLAGLGHSAPAPTKSEVVPLGRHPGTLASTLNGGNRESRPGLLPKLDPSRSSTASMVGSRRPSQIPQGPVKPAGGGPGAPTA